MKRRLRPPRRTPVARRKTTARRRLAAPRIGIVRGCVREPDGDLAAHVRILLDGSELADECGRFTAWVPQTRTYTFTVLDGRGGRTLLVRRKVLEAGVAQDIELRLPPAD